MKPVWDGFLAGLKEGCQPFTQAVAKVMPGIAAAIVMMLVGVGAVIMGTVLIGEILVLASAIVMLLVTIFGWAAIFKAAKLWPHCDTGK